MAKFSLVIEMPNLPISLYLKKNGPKKQADPLPERPAF